MQLPVLCALVISCWLRAELMIRLFNGGNHIVLLGLCVVRVVAGQFCQELSIKTFLKCSGVKHLDSFQRRTIELRYPFTGDNLLPGYKNLRHPPCCGVALCCDGKCGLPRASPRRQWDTCGRAPNPPRECTLLRVNICPLEGRISYTKSSNFNPFPGIFIFTRLH